MTVTGTALAPLAARGSGTQPTKHPDPNPGAAPVGPHSHIQKEISH